jgi:hypothetical protein
LLVFGTLIIYVLPNTRREPKRNRRDDYDIPEVREFLEETAKEMQQNKYTTL